MRRPSNGYEQIGAVILPSGAGVTGFTAQGYAVISMLTVMLGVLCNIILFPCIALGLSPFYAAYRKYCGGKF